MTSILSSASPVAVPIRNRSSSRASLSYWVWLLGAPGAVLLMIASQFI